MGWIILVFALSFGLKKEEQEWILISAAVSFLIAGVLGGVFGNIYNREAIVNISFWVIFLFLASSLLFEDLYMKIFNHFKTLIKKK